MTTDELEIIPDQNSMDNWRVEWSDDPQEGLCNGAIFYGPNAEHHAREYHEFKKDRPKP